MSSFFWALKHVLLLDWAAKPCSNKVHYGEAFRCNRDFRVLANGLQKGRPGGQRHRFVERPPLVPPWCQGALGWRETW